MSAINSMSGNDYETILMDLSEYFKEWSYSFKECKDTDKLKEELLNKFKFLGKDNINKVIDSLFMFNANNIEDFIITAIKMFAQEFKSINEIVITNKKFTDKPIFTLQVYRCDKISKHLNDDIDITKMSDEYLLLREFKQSRFESIAEGSSIFKLIIDPNMDFENLSKIPKGFKLKSDIGFNNDLNIYNTIVCSDDATIEINSNVEIHAELPIDITSCNQLTIKGSGHLTLIPGYQQPCIGSLTHTGMSYGRWSPGPKIKCKKIIIDGCTVDCLTKVDCFSIGRYGTNEMVEIELVNGGSIDCPEAYGERYVEYQATPPCGSTKISNSMQYAIKSK
jgi:hypothetical protein